MKPGDCVKINSRFINFIYENYLREIENIGRIRKKEGNYYKVRIKNSNNKYYKFYIIQEKYLKWIECPRGWMSKEGYNNYLRKTLSKIKQRQKK